MVVKDGARFVGLVVPTNAASIRVLNKSGRVFETTVEYQLQRLAQYAVRAFADGIDDDSCGPQ